VPIVAAMTDTCCAVRRLEHLSLTTRRRYMRAAWYATYAQSTGQDNSRDAPDLTRLFTENTVSHKAIRFERSGIHGWGVFADEPIHAGEPIVEYIGERVRERVVDHRQQLYESRGNHGSYVFRVSFDQYVDATHRGGVARYINHSCDPNCRAQTVFHDGLARIVIFAKRNIRPCEELCYDYRLPYEAIDKRIPCFCGAAGCKGWLNWADKSEGSSEPIVVHRPISCESKMQLLTDVRALAPDNERLIEALQPILQIDADSFVETSD
jgi:hypothetical protein